MELCVIMVCMLGWVLILVLSMWVIDSIIFFLCVLVLFVVFGFLLLWLGLIVIVSSWCMCGLFDGVCGMGCLGMIFSGGVFGVLVSVDGGFVDVVGGVLCGGVWLVNVGGCGFLIGGLVGLLLLLWCVSVVIGLLLFDGFGIGVLLDVVKCFCLFLVVCMSCISGLGGLVGYRLNMSWL